MTIAVIKRARGVVIKSGVNSAEVRRQAELAEADADRAKAEADRAETEKLGSESARDAAIAYLNPYADQAAGEAATSEGELFSYLDANDEVALAKRTAGGSDLLPVYFGASKVGLSDGATAQQSIAVAATPTALLASTASLPVGATVRTADGHVYDVVSSNEHLTTAGGVKLVVKPSPDGQYNIRAFGAVGDYDADTETPGAVASSATDNYDAINAARLAVENHIGGVELVFPGPGDYWASNMPRFRRSNFAIRIEQGAVLRTTTPTSFGTTIHLGDDDTENVRIYGGGAVRNFLPDPDDYAAWAASTVYAPATYIKNSAGHVYWTELGGTSGTTEPTGVAAPQNDGGVIWRDALNDNGISLHGNNARCIGMLVPEASNKGITAQLPPWENLWITDNIVGSTWFAGIEAKGNQGLSGQESLFGKHAWVERNVVQDAGGHGIHAEQPSQGTNKNRHITVRSNIVVKAGYREGEKAGIRVNRCVNPVVTENSVLDAAGNAFHIRACDNVRCDGYAEKFGTVGMFLQNCSNIVGGMVDMANSGTATGAAIEVNGCAGPISFDGIRASGGNYIHAYRAIGSARVTAGTISLTDGTDGRINGDAPHLYTPRLVAVKLGSAAGLALNTTITPLAWDATPLYDSGDFSVSSGEVTIPAGVDVVAIEGTLATGNVGEVRVYIEMKEGGSFNLIAFADGEGTGGEGATASVDLLPVSEGDVLRMAGSISTGTTTSTAVYDQFTVRVVAGDILTQAT